MLISLPTGQTLAIFSSVSSSSAYLQRLCANEISEIEKNNRNNFIIETEKYEQYKNIKMRLERNLKVVKGRASRENIIDLCKCIELVNQKGSFIIIEACKDIPEIKSKLSMRVTLESTKEGVSNPYEHNCLTGLMQNLKNSFCTPSLLIFIRGLLDILKFSGQQNIFDSISHIDNVINTWDQMELYEKFMSKDRLFLIVLINCYSGDGNRDIRADLIEQVTTKLNIMERIMTMKTLIMNLKVWGWDLMKIQKCHYMNIFPHG